MKNGLQMLFLMFFGYLSAQINTTKSVFFDLDKSSLHKNEAIRILSYLDSTNFSQCKAIYIYGYCDDRATDAYNDKLSEKRVDFVQKLLISHGVPQVKIFICQGLGKVDLNKDTVKNLKSIKNKNRRVDLIFVQNIFQTSLPTNPKVGVLIVLERVTFDLGSSELSGQAKNELDKVILKLKNHKTIQFEIKGHVCCTTNEFKDAIDNKTQNRDLSENRAKNVFNYFRSKGINPYRMSYKGYGNRFPQGKEDFKDRRVELHITKI
jgi:outer membrane protein OmpA-like peptidoglycan-associated protein